MPLTSILALVGLIVGLWMEQQGYTKAAMSRLVSKALVLWVYPCLIFSSLLLRLTWPEVKALYLLPLLIFLLCAFGYIVGKLSLTCALLKQNPTRRSYVFLAIMPNYSYLPLVISQALWGDKALALVAIASVGADAFLWTWAYPEISGHWDWKKIFSPALLTLGLAALLLCFEWKSHQEPWLSILTILSWIGKGTLPLSMYILGTFLAKANRTVGDKRAHGLLLGWRLVLSPLLMFLFLVKGGTGLPFVAQAVLLLIASMPSAIISVVLADLHAADAEFAATQIFLGHGLAALTAAAWQMALYTFVH